MCSNAMSTRVEKSSGSSLVFVVPVVVDLPGADIREYVRSMASACDTLMICRTSAISNYQIHPHLFHFMHAISMPSVSMPSVCHQYAIILFLSNLFLHAILIHNYLCLFFRDPRHVQWTGKLASWEKKNLFHGPLNFAMARLSGSIKWVGTEPDEEIVNSYSSSAPYWLTLCPPLPSVRCIL